MKTFIAALAITFALAHATSAVNETNALSSYKNINKSFVYYSQELWQAKLVEYKRACVDIGMPSKSRNCLLAVGRSIKPERHSLGGRYVMAIRDDNAMRAIVDAFSRCIPDIGKPRSGHIRKYVEPTTLIRRFAYMIGFKETIQAEECGACDGGCHFCCVNSGISGSDYCFLVFCPHEEHYCR